MCLDWIPEAAAGHADDPRMMRFSVSHWGWDASPRKYPTPLWLKPEPWLGGRFCADLLSRRGIVSPRHWGRSDTNCTQTKHQQVFALTYIFTSALVIWLSYFVLCLSVIMHTFFMRMERFLVLTAQCEYWDAPCRRPPEPARRCLRCCCRPHWAPGVPGAAAASGPAPGPPGPQVQCASETDVSETGSPAGPPAECRLRTQAEGCRRVWWGDSYNC